MDVGERTALVFAVVERHGEVRILLARGASKDAQDSISRTPLMVATAASQKDIVQNLLENGAWVDLRNHNWQTELQNAEERGRKETTLMLLGVGPDPNALDNQRPKPLDLAKLGRHRIIVKLLKPPNNEDYN